MLTAQTESLIERLEELKPLFVDHYHELALDQDKVPLDPQYGVYLERDRAGQVLFVTVRKDAAIIAYFVGFVFPHLHYATCLTLQMDIFWSCKEHRDGSPKAAMMLFREVEREARRRGVSRWVVGSKLHRDASRLFERLGFSPVETIYSKWIGEEAANA